MLDPTNATRALSSIAATPPVGFFRAFLSTFTWRMAWRDSRSSRWRLLLFCTSIVIGIAALVAISSFGKSLRQAIDVQALALIGADLSLGSRQPIQSKADALLDKIGNERAREIDLVSMVSFPASTGSRLVDLRGLDSGYPFYGDWETVPLEAGAAFRRGEGALVEETLLVQMGAKVGDAIKLGKATARVLGSVRKVPGETSGFAALAPRVFVSMRLMDETGLLTTGSLARHKVHFRLPPRTNVRALVKRIQPELNELKLGVSTVESKKQELGRAIEQVTQYLILVGFVALLLGGVGVASAIHVYIRQKLDSVAVLRCLGSSVGRTFAIYLIQGLALGAVGAMAGALLGVGLQWLLPRIFATYLPFPVPSSIAWAAVGIAMAQGFVICVLFALLPLLGVRRVSPLAALRVSYETQPVRRDPLQWLACAVLAGSVVAFCLLNAPRWQRGLGFAGGMAVAFLLLALVARLLIWSMKKITRPHWPFVVRQGLANLHRPNNRTVLLMLSLGLGTFLILTLYLVQNNILREIAASRPATEANIVLFDVQPDQREGAVSLIKDQGLKVVDEAPIITLRLRSLQERTVEQLLGDKQKTIPNWVLRREYRSSIGQSLRPGEKVLSGTFPPRVDAKTGTIGLSIEDGLAKEMGIGLGARMEFDLQGVPLAAQVTSIRDVDWRRVQPSFFLLFPGAAFEDAPRSHVLLTRAGSAQQSATLQRSVVQRFPNVSVIDVSLMLQTLDAIVDKVAFIIRFMAFFTVGTGLLVLAGAVLTGRYQRLRESILLRTLGASRKQVGRILLVEYLSLGALAAATGIVLSVAATWALAFWAFEIPFAPDSLALLAAVGIVSGLTALVGLAGNRGVMTHPPLEILRSAGS
jgi:putative ABC transport system permease protein